MRNPKQQGGEPERKITIESGTWFRDADGDFYLEQTITEEEYDALVASYPPVPMELIPIDQFPAE